MEIARTAAHYGAAVVSNAEVVGVLREGGRVTGVRVRDMTTGDELEVAAREVVNATGVWTDDVQGLVGERGQVPRARLQGHPPRGAARPRAGSTPA